jgi:glyoxylase-like metal-dependent hydrolase (beta-lactamase superfamily II)
MMVAKLLPGKCVAPGPPGNNVFVVRCKHTGEAVLIDAANEHERLLELCQALGVRSVLETHGHHDHIQAIPAMREAGYSVAVSHDDAGMLKDVGYDVFLDDTQVVEVGKLRFDVIHNPDTLLGLCHSKCTMHHCYSLATRCFLVALAQHIFPAAVSTPSLSH